MSESTENKVKTTVMLNKTLKKLAKLHALQNDQTLQEVIEEGLRKVLVENEQAGK